MSSHGPLRVGIGGPVGSGKTALMDLLCKSMRERYDIAAITNDIYTKWDAEFLVRSGSLTPDRIAGVETGGCPHTAIREDASMNLAAVADMRAKFPDLDMVLIESGGDNLAATFSPELADLTIYVIDVAAGDKIPSKGGPGITRSDLLVINKIDLAPHVGASLEKMDTDARRMRGERPFVMTNLQEERRSRPHHRFHRGQGRPSSGRAGQGELTGWLALWPEYVIPGREARARTCNLTSGISHPGLVLRDHPGMTEYRSRTAAKHFSRTGNKIHRSSLHQSGLAKNGDRRLFLSSS